MDNRVFRYLPIINKEIFDNKYPFPAPLITALIWVESRGTIGAVNPKSGASGLMQVMPIALKDYNQRSGNPILSMTDMRSKSEDKAHDQIRVGMWLLGNFWIGAWRYLSKRLPKVSIPDLVKIADTFYVAGPNRMRKLLDKVAHPTFANALDKYPKSNALGHAIKVWTSANQAGAVFEENRINQWLGQPIEDTVTPIEIDETTPDTGLMPLDGAIWGLIMIGLFWYLVFETKGGYPRET